MTLHRAVARQHGCRLRTTSSYVSLLPAGMIILALFGWKPTELDDQMGRFSYTIYLAQYPSAMALLLLGIVPGFWGVMAATLMISALFLAFIDAPIQHLPQKIR